MKKWLNLKLKPDTVNIIFYDTCMELPSPPIKITPKKKKTDKM